VFPQREHHLQSKRASERSSRLSALHEHFEIVYNCSVRIAICTWLGLCGLSISESEQRWVASSTYDDDDDDHDDDEEEKGGGGEDDDGVTADNDDDDDEDNKLFRRYYHAFMEGDYLLARSISPRHFEVRSLIVFLIFVKMMTMI